MYQATSDLNGIVSQISNFKWLLILLEALRHITLAKLTKVVHTYGQNLVLLGHEEGVLTTRSHVSDLDAPS